jgi:hypothetical protein
VIAALVEGNSIRSVERMTGIHRDTIIWLMIRVGDGCDRLMDEMMRGLTCERLQIDEIWAYVGMMQKTARLPNKTDDFGDLYAFGALDADTKLIPCWQQRRGQICLICEYLAPKLWRLFLVAGRFRRCL